MNIQTQEPKRMALKKRIEQGYSRSLKDIREYEKRYGPMKRKTK